jgi:hypothetical protein
VLSLEAFGQKARSFQREIDEKYIGPIIRALRQARRADAIPDGRQTNEGVSRLAVIMAASGDIELAEQSRLDDPAKRVVGETLGFVNDGIWEKALTVPEASDVIKSKLQDLSERVEILRTPALSVRRELGGVMPQKEQIDEEAELDEQFADEFGDEEASDEEPEPEPAPEDDKEARKRRAAEKLRAAMTGEVAEEAPKRAKRSRQGDGRVPPEQVIETMRVAQGRALLREDCKADLEAFKRFEATRRSPIRPSAAVLEATKKDVLLFMLQDRTTQVWAKGAITVTFAAPGQGLSSIQKASQYAKIWRECKKSRHECRIVVGVEGSDEYLVKAPALVGPASAGELLSLASVGKAAGIEEKSNPRRKNRARQVSAAAFWPKALRNLRIRTPDRELASFIRNPLR